MFNEKPKHLKINEKRIKTEFWLKYTAVFAMAFALCYCWFLFAGKAMVWYDDGRSQHLTSLTYLGVWLRDIIRGIFSGSLSFPTYSFGLGYGGDIIQILHYYSVGDPLDLLSVFVPSSMTVVLYSFLIVLRLYLAGLAFSKLCFFFDRDRARFGVLAGAVLYVFGGFALFSASRHPYFINPMIYFPMVIVGVEKIRLKQSPLVLALGVFLSAVSNFYFFYMTVLLTALYVAVRFIFVRKGMTVRTTVVYVLRLFLFSGMGVIMAGAVILPVIIQFMTDPRGESSGVAGLLFSKEYYANLPGVMLTLGETSDQWIQVGLTGLLLPSVFTLFAFRGKRGFLKAGFIILTLFVFLPYAAHVLNGMSYAAHRWLWAYALLAAYIVADTAEDLIKMTKRQYLWCLAFVGVYLALCAVTKLSFNAAALAQAALALLLTAALTVVKGSERLRAALPLTAAILGVGLNALFGVSAPFSSYLDKYWDAGNFNTVFNSNEATLLQKEYSGKGFYRYTDPDPFLNASLLHGNSSTQFFFSFSNPNIFEWFTELDTTVSMSLSYTDLDDRAALNTLANVRYYACDSESDENGAPYGFSAKPDEWSFDTSGTLRKSGGSGSDTLKAVNIYKNKNALPFGYTYSSYLPRDRYEVLTSLEKQEAQLQCVVLDETSDLLPEGEPVFTGEDIPYTISPKDGKVKAAGENRFVAVDKNAKLVLTLDGAESCETYLYLGGIDFRGINPRDVYTDEEWSALPGEKRAEISAEAEFYEEPSKLMIGVVGKSGESKVRKVIRHHTPRYKWYLGKRDYLVNLGYEKAGKKKIYINLPSAGEYLFSDIKVYCQPMDSFSAQAGALKAETLSGVDFHRVGDSAATNEITGKISVSENKALLLSIPYSDGWTAYVDGEETKLLRANTAFSAVQLKKGAHSIRLKYSTPGFKPGLLLSAAGIAGFVLTGVLRRKLKS